MVDEGASGGCSKSRDGVMPEVITIGCWIIKLFHNPENGTSSHKLYYPLSA